VLSGIKGFFPNLSSHYYDSNRLQSEEEIERSWPPDQEMFSPLIWKRSTYFLLIGGSLIVFQLIIQFSYSKFAALAWWKFMFLFYFIQKIIGWTVMVILNEEMLKIPIIALSQINMELTVIGSQDSVTFVTAMFLMNLIYMFDRLYVSPHEIEIAQGITRSMNRLIRGTRKIAQGRSAAGTAPGSQDPLTEIGADGIAIDDTAAVMGGEGVVGTTTAAATTTTGPTSSASNTHGMMRFLSCYVSSQLTIILTPLAYYLLLLFYYATQTMNYQDVPISVGVYFILPYLVSFPLRLVLDIIVLNTAEVFYEWRVLDYLEYCRYRFLVRPCRWKGTNEIADELLSPDLRSLDLFSFSSQVYFVCFLICIGGTFISTGLQIVINNAWNIFDDQATPFIVVGSILIMGIIKSAVLITADYLRIWSVGKRGETAETAVTVESAAAQTLEDNYEQLLSAGAGHEDDASGHRRRPVSLRAPVGSVLYNWPEPSPGDKGGWDRYRLAYLKENQLWLQAHMDALIDSQTTMDYRRKLMDSLAKVLKESNIIELQNQRRMMGMDLPSDNRPSSISGAITLARALEFSSAPMHDGAVLEVTAAREEFKNTATELAAITFLNRAKFLKFLTDSILDIRLDQSTRIMDFCESCGAEGKRTNLAMVPEYPVSYVADQFRIQRGNPDTWNVPLWQQYYQQVTPVCTLCAQCREFNSNRNHPVQIGQLMVRGRGDAEYLPKPCREVLRDNPYNLPTSALPLDATRALSRWFKLASEISDPRVSDSRIESVLMQAGYKRSPNSSANSTSRRHQRRGNVFEGTVVISDTSRAILGEWVTKARIAIRQRSIVATSFAHQ